MTTIAKLEKCARRFVRAADKGDQAAYAAAGNDLCHAVLEHLAANLGPLVTSWLAGQVTRALRG